MVRPRRHFRRMTGGVMAWISDGVTSGCSTQLTVFDTSRRDMAPADLATCHSPCGPDPGQASALLRAGRAGAGPGGPGGQECLARHRGRLAAEARVPRPGDERVIEVLAQRGHVLAAV